ncbi:TPR repeat region protein [Toxoplasma gondii VAND]|uniref:TPR repeat region protein n=1 Tax=Toxoplasma gondii VAND TaxID=933077 RepID=A0A086PJW7_TOXGO|nr:TPR repeat region protein [Toxoplasma gondii VAND]
MATPVCSLPLSALRHSFLLRSLTPLRCSLSSTLSPLSLLSSLSPSSLSPSSRSPFSRSSSSSSSLSSLASLSSLSSPLSCVSSASRTFSSLSLQDGICGSDEKSVIRASERLKRLMYRAKQRGWVELDLLLGAYCDENVPSMSTEVCFCCLTKTTKKHVKCLHPCRSSTMLPGHRACYARSQCCTVGEVKESSFLLKVSLPTWRRLNCTTRCAL